MALSKSLQLRLKTLKFNLERLNSAYEETKSDYVIDSGISYSKNYPYNQETRKLIKAAEKLKTDREETLFHHIFNFTQTLYSIKEYLKQEYPTNKVDIEKFFSEEKIKDISRKEIANDLKHNPSKDLKYDLKQVDEQTYIEGKSIKTEISMNRSWFYGELDSVDHCNKLFKELTNFTLSKLE